MKPETFLHWNIRWLRCQITRKYLYVNFWREWDRFAKGEYERLAMEEEGGDDSEMIDAMEGWDSEDDKEGAEGEDKKEAKESKKKTAAASAETKVDASWTH